MTGGSSLPTGLLAHNFQEMLTILGSALRWLFIWVYYVLVTCFIGAILGVLTHACFGLLFMEEPDYGYLAAFGFQNGLRYGSVWAGGLAIVLCVMRARREYLATRTGRGL